MMVDRVFTSIPFSRDMVAKVCPYGIIRTNRKTLAVQGVDWFILILFPQKRHLNGGYGRGCKTRVAFKGQ
ncbi:MAG: hypothetical protein K2P04_02120, partial [Oscillospiraceae bacterium]|nr:hypothetical protein [Oscillospiraceae bacterium]